MLKFVSFGSGSSGNCYYLSNGEGAIFIDAGIGIRKIKKAMKEYGISPNDIKAIIVTHDHADHVKGAGYLSMEYGIPVYATELVHQGMISNYHATKKVETSRAIKIDKDLEFTVAGFSIIAFTIPHDSNENVGYYITYGEESFSIMTDVGMPTDTIKEYIGKTKHLVLESNYDEDLLRNGKYPQILKARIMSGTGHLSNNQAANLLSDCFHENLKTVMLCHLSEENNHPELARKTIEYHLRSFGIIAGKDFQLEILRRNLPTGPFELK